MKIEHEVLIAVASAILHHESNTALTQSARATLELVASNRWSKDRNDLYIEFRPAIGTVTLHVGRQFSDDDPFRVEIGWSSPGSHELELVQGFADLITSVCDLAAILRELNTTITRVLSQTASAS